jgi:hypothetical protein
MRRPSNDPKEISKLIRKRIGVIQKRMKRQKLGQQVEGRLRQIILEMKGIEERFLDNRWVTTPLDIHHANASLATLSKSAKHLLMSTKSEPA